jgi:TonB family protein
MTTRRLIASLGASAAALGLATFYAVRAFPLAAQGQAPTSDAPVQIVKGAEHLLHGDLPEYPARAAKAGVEGDVVLDLDLDERGEVSDARVSSGPEALRRAALESVLGWHYASPAMSSTSTQAILRFRASALKEALKEKERLLAHKIEFVNMESRAKVPESHFVEGKPVEIVPDSSMWEHKFVVARQLEEKKNLEHRMVELKSALASPDLPADKKAEFEAKLRDTSVMLTKAAKENEFELIEIVPEKAVRLDGTQRLTRIEVERLSPATAREVLAHSGVQIGDQLTEQTFKRIVDAASSIDEHLSVRLSAGKAGATVVLIAR